MVELRQPEKGATTAFYHGTPGERISRPGRLGHTSPIAPIKDHPSDGSPVDMWIASLHLPLPWDEYLDRHGFPIRYPYVKESYESVLPDGIRYEKGSAEMPSAGRAFTPKLITRLVSVGVRLGTADPAHRRCQPGEK